MTNQIKVSSIVFGDSINRVIAWKNENNQENPKIVSVNSTTIQWKEWKNAYQEIKTNYIGPYTFLHFLDSYNRVIEWKNNNEQVNPKTVRVNQTTLTWEDWNNLFTNIFKNITITVVIPDTPKKAEETHISGILPVYHFNQQAMGRPWGEYCCGPVSALICASHHDLVDFKNFQAKNIGLITAMNTRVGSGTSPNDMVAGFNKYFTTLEMTPVEFTEKNFKYNILKSIPMVVNVLTDSTIGYKGRFGHYMAVTGYDNGKIGVSDPHGFNIGRGQRYWYPYNVIKRVRDNNFGGRPLWVISRK
ncbi:MAG: C39 family peptidase [Methanobacteriaceae archaeon]|jgi:hypothetical protein|nr:C39 family peptidase [Candidatus Methanorudis spinitermitis]